MTDIIIKALMNDNPVLNDKIHILLISKQYLQIFNFLKIKFICNILKIIIEYHSC